MSYGREDIVQGNNANADQEDVWTRRSVLGGAATAAGMLGLVGTNVFLQARRGQAPYQHQSNHYPPAMKQVAAGEPVDIHTVHVHFGEGPEYNAETYNNIVENTLEQLDGLEVEKYWEEIEVTPKTWMDHEDSIADAEKAYAHAEKEVEQIRSAVTGYDTDASHSESMGAIEDVISHYEVDDILDKENVLGIVTPVNMKEAAGREFYGRSFIEPQNSAQELANLSIHEYLHSFGVEHAYNPADTMSYSPLNIILDDFVTIPITDETKRNWEKERSRAEREYGSS